MPIAIGVVADFGPIDIANWYEPPINTMTVTAETIATAQPENSATSNGTKKRRTLGN